ncbi:MAG: FG-GAP-like repeat-containing protein [Acidobacteriia bacterium]|nr:FG-GAP-like repeat-containing protein [Terriglobia bacterium]
MVARKLVGFWNLWLLLAVVPQLLGAAATVTLSTSPTPYPSAFVLTAAVGSGTATGTVTFYDGVTVLGTARVEAGVAHATILLPAGSRNLKAVYSGDGVNPPATSNAVASVSTAASSHFGPASVVIAGTFALAVVGDFNHDGKADVAGISDGAVVVDLNSIGTVQTTLPVNNNLANPTFAAAADFNGDGNPDLVVVSGGTFVNILLGNGDGTFQPPVKYVTSGSPLSVAVGDFNGDTKVDLAVTNSNGTVSIFLGNGNGTFPPSAGYPGGGGSPVVVGDFNGDGKADLATLNGSDGTLRILLGNGDGTFQAALASTNRGALAPSSLAVVDLDGDGKADLAIADSVGHAVLVLIGNGDGTFKAAVSYAAGSGAESVAVLDANGDGKLDLAVANPFDGTVSVFLGNGDGTLQAAVNYPAVSPNFVTVGDINSDGKTDLIVTSFPAGNVSVLLASNVTLTVQAGTPQSATIGTAFGTALQVLVEDSGTPVAGAVVTFTVPASGASATGNPTATTNGAGVASLTVTANNVAGSYTVTASYQGLTGSFALTNTPGPPANIAITGGSPQLAVVGTPFANPLQVTVTDVGGNLLSGVTVTYVPPASGATAVLSSTTAVTNAAGVASVTATANNIAGTYTVSASVGALSSLFALINTLPQAGSLKATGGTPQSAAVGTAFGVALQATLKDTAGSPLGGVTLNFFAPTSAATAVLSSGTAVTNAAGVASITATASNTVGSYTVTASNAPLGTDGALVAFFQLTNTPGAPASITATGGTPQTALVGAAFAGALQATVKDLAGNLISGITVTFAAPASGASAVLSSTSAVTNAAGVASVTATANTTPGNYTVTASVGGLSASFSLSNAASPPASLTATGGTPQSTPVGTAFANALQVMVKDAQGSPVSGVNITFTAPVSGPS